MDTCYVTAALCTLAQSFKQHWEFYTVLKLKLKNQINPLKICKTKSDVTMLLSFCYITISKALRCE